MNLGPDILSYNWTQVLNESTFHHIPYSLGGGGGPRILGGGGPLIPLGGGPLGPGGPLCGPPIPGGGGPRIPGGGGRPPAANKIKYDKTKDFYSWWCKCNIVLQ